MELSPPLNHVFVDYENVSAIDETVIGNKGVTFTLLLGPQKKKLDVELVEKLFAHAVSVELIRLTRSGRNALDFALAYYLGRAVAADPTGSFHLIAKDTGYDPLIEHLRRLHFDVQRHEDFSKLPFAGVAKPRATTTRAQAPVAKSKARATLPVEPLVRVVEHLRKHQTNRPKRRKTLSAHLKGFPGVPDTEEMIDRLITARYIAIDEKGAVTYLLAEGN